MISKQYLVEENDLFQHSGRYESLFSLANGKIGIRGFHDFLSETWHEATIYMNHFYDTEDYIYGEEAYGFAKKKQKMLPLPHDFGRKILVNGQVLELSMLNHEKSQRYLDMQSGILHATYTFTLSPELEITIKGQRLVSLIDTTLIWQHYELQTTKSCQVTWEKQQANSKEHEEFDPRLGSLNKEKALHLKTQEQFMAKAAQIATYQTDESGLYLAVGEIEVIKIAAEILHNQATVELSPTSPIEWLRMFYYTDVEQPLLSQQEVMQNAFTLGLSHYLDAQQQILTAFWQQQDLAINDNPALSQSLFFNIFHLYQHAGKDGIANICAKGLSGEGYEGHYFWDTEIYVLPFFTYTMPEIARKLLLSRYAMLDKARARAKEMSYKGAMYAWRTINGEEASAYYPAGTAQIHINADIAYAINQYYAATKDEEFMEQYGLEMLIEIARFFADFADEVEGKGWVINGVTGPDEYHTMTNNNAYTNLMVKKQFRNLIDYNHTRTLKTVNAAEITLWQTIADNLYLKKQGLLTAQDDQFFERVPWDFERRPKRPLLINYHPMVIYKHQVLKQADLVLAMLLCHDEFTLEEIQANYNYYEPLTTHDSSLSETVHGIIAAEINDMETAYRYFYETTITDLYDTHNNTADGVHIAAMAGGWQSLVFGFGGLRITKDKLSFTPKISEDLSSYRFSIYFRGVKITVNVNNGDVEITTDKEPQDFTIILNEVK